MNLQIEADGFKIMDVSLAMLMNLLALQGKPTLFAVGTRVKTTVTMGLESISEEFTVLEDEDHE